MRTTLSLCLLVKEEPELEPFLEHIKDLVDEIIAVVAPDEPFETIRILQDYNAKIEYYPWQNNFSISRNKSIEKASGDWILWLDPDCRVHKESQTKIREFINNSKMNAASFRYIHIKTDCKYIVNLVCLFRNKIGIKFKGVVYENPEIPEFEIEETSIQIDHYGYISEKRPEKTKQYIEMLELALIKDPEDRISIDALLINSSKFDKAYMVRFLDFSRFYLEKKYDVSYFIIIWRAKFWTQLDKPEEAIKELETAISFRPELPGAYNWLVNIYNKLKKYDPAYQNCLKVISLKTENLNPKEYDIDEIEYLPLLNLGILEVKKGNFLKAESYFLEAHKKREQEKEPIIYLLRTYNTINDKEKFAIYKAKLDELF